MVSVVFSNINDPVIHDTSGPYVTQMYMTPCSEMFHALMICVPLKIAFLAIVEVEVQADNPQKMDSSFSNGKVWKYLPVLPELHNNLPDIFMPEQHEGLEKS